MRKVDVEGGRREAPGQAGKFEKLLVENPVGDRGWSVVAESRSRKELLKCSNSEEWVAMRSAGFLLKRTGLTASSVGES